MKKVLLWVLGIVIGLAVLGSIFGDKKDASAPAQTADASGTATVEAKPAAVNVTASELVKAYKDNEVAANEKYKGKMLLVSGSIDSIDAGMGDEPVIMLKSSGDYGMNNPHAELADSDVKKAGTLKKGQAIKLLCKGNSEIAGSPMLADCVIQ